MTNFLFFVKGQQTTDVKAIVRIFESMPPLFIRQEEYAVFSELISFLLENKNKISIISDDFNHTQKEYDLMEFLSVLFSSISNSKKLKSKPVWGHNIYTDNHGFTWLK